MARSFYEIFSFLELPDISILDIGASAIDGNPPYQSLKNNDRAIIYGCEPSPEEYQKLTEHASEREIYLPYALGDGKKATLNICSAPGMTSLLKPDYQILEYFHAFPQWANIVATEEIMTHRLDDIAELKEIDYIKLDVQGSELQIIQNGANTISNSLLIHTEVYFIPSYENQPLFAEIDLALRNLGFFLHTFAPIHKRIFKPLAIKDNIYAGLNQMMWTDAVYLKKFTDFDSLSSEELIKIAIIMHDLYQSFDVVVLALQSLENKENFDFTDFYLQEISENQGDG